MTAVRQRRSLLPERSAADRVPRVGGLRRRSGTALGALLLVFSLVVGLLAVDAATATPSGAAGCAGSSAIALAERSAEDRFVSKLNRFRTSKGLRALATNSAIGYGSDQWSATMASRNTLFHDANYFGKILGVVSGLLGAAENVGRATTSRWCSSAELNAAVARAVDLMHSNFVGSLKHYLNMVGLYNQVGVGVEVVSGNLWVTVRFARGTLPAATTEATRRYLDALHRLFLGRSATSTDVSRWAGMVQAGNRGAVTRALAVSNEWAGVRINDLYRTILGRSADSAGRRYWLSRVASGTRLEDVAAGFYASREYFAGRGGTNRGFVAGLYRDILGRSPDAAGLNSWVNLLNSGRASRQSVASGFYASTESRRDRVTALYREILNRRPDSSGLSYWGNRLLTVGDVSLASFLAASSEYYRRSSR